MAERWKSTTGYELYSGKARHDTGFEFFANRMNWNLLLIRKGVLKLTISGQIFHFPKGSLVLIEPGPERLFTVEESWAADWIHFNSDAHLQFQPEWPAVGKGVHLVTPLRNDFMEMCRLFDGVNTLCRIRRIGWYRLGYCMVQEILLRGEMIQGKGLDAEHIEFAVQALADFSDERKLNKIAAKCQLSRAVFFRKFKETFGETPGEYRKKIQMNKVREFLETTNWGLKEIAFKLKLGNPFYLSVCFKKMYGLSPREYRRQFQKDKSQPELPHG